MASAISCQAFRSRCTQWPMPQGLCHKALVSFLACVPQGLCPSGPVSFRACVLPGLCPSGPLQPPPRLPHPARDPNRARSGVGPSGWPHRRPTAARGRRLVPGEARLNVRVPLCARTHIAHAHARTDSHSARVQCVRACARAHARVCDNTCLTYFVWAVAHAGSPRVPP
jgi:hypothetical protein